MSEGEICGRPFPDGSRCNRPKGVSHGHDVDPPGTPLAWRLMSHLEEAFVALKRGYGLTSSHERRLAAVVAEGFAACASNKLGDLGVASAHTRAAMHMEMTVLRAAREQLEVQLAGCLTAAEGHGVDEDNCAKRGQYGWSPAYQAVLELRQSWERMADAIKKQGPPVPVDPGSVTTVAGHWSAVAEPPMPVDGSAWHDHVNDEASFACKLCGLDDFLADKSPHRRHPQGGWERIEYLGVNGSAGTLRVYVAPEPGTPWPGYGSRVWLMGRPGEWLEHFVCGHRIDAEGAWLKVSPMGMVGPLPVVTIAMADEGRSWRRTPPPPAPEADSGMPPDGGQVWIRANRRDGKGRVEHGAWYSARVERISGQAGRFITNLDGGHGTLYRDLMDEGETWRRTRPEPCACLCHREESDPGRQFAHIDGLCAPCKGSGFKVDSVVPAQGGGS